MIVTSMLIIGNPLLTSNSIAYGSDKFYNEEQYQSTMNDDNNNDEIGHLFLSRFKEI
jgi:hypothetical protein